jgi:hypothetical protein
MDSEPLDGIEAVGGGYRIVAPDQKLSAAFRDAYWARVKQALRHVFRGDEAEADAARERVDVFQKTNGHLPALFYHADPFDVAADLAGRRGQEITSEEMARYQEVLRDEALSPASRVNATHPEAASQA